MKIIKLKTPLSDKDIVRLKIGDRVLLSGTLITARDEAHKRLSILIRNRCRLPLDIKKAIIYYTGPAPAPPGRIIGPAGPTTSGRMDPYTEALLKAGIQGMIGKGKRSSAVRKAMKKYKCLYFVATGGASALISKSIKASRIAAYGDLGPEAVRILEVKDFPVVVANDIFGSDIYEYVSKKRHGK